MYPSGASRRFLVLVLLVAGLLSVSLLVSYRNGAQGDGQAASIVPSYGHGLDTALPGKAIAPKLGNATAKAELGRAAWKVLHTTLARFPEKPTKDESAALLSYIHLFQRLYPCGECAEHFRTVLEKYPPQVSSRNSASGWGCVAHNEVNKRLGKDIFDCSKIGDFYDCGCADDEKAEAKGEAEDKEREEATVDGDASLELQKEGYQRGG